MHNGQQKPNMGRKKKGAKWVKRPAKSNGSWGDDGRYPDARWENWRKSCSFYCLATLKLWVSDEVLTKAVSVLANQWMI